MEEQGGRIREEIDEGGVERERELRERGGGVSIEGIGRERCLGSLKKNGREGLYIYMYIYISEMVRFSIIQVFFFS